MLVLATSVPAITHLGHPIIALVDALKRINALGHHVGIISNHDKPHWFDQTFSGSNVGFRKAEGRQNGNVIREAAKAFGANPFDFLVLASTNDDVQMAKNGGAVLIGAGWSPDQDIRDLGLSVNSPAQIEELIQLINGWNGRWWFNGAMPTYTAKALVNLSSMGNNISAAQQAFGQRLTNTVKNGGNRLTALTAIAAKSLLIDGTNNFGNLIWGVYPSSSNTGANDEVLTDFCHRLRTTVSKVRYARRGEPLFLRHTASTKRSTNKSSQNRLDPTEQIETIHLNPVYKKTMRGRNVIVIDDCTTYGLSFAVAAGFLFKAGAASVTGIALGKFGNSLNYFDVKINSDPFSPVSRHQFSCSPPQPFTGQTDHTAQNILIQLIP
ncbi:hypothetical protein [Pseudomonas oryzihabitans]|uniref:hypothetical protein n=1 Tax=Pseudomonas oryzihabitans TaxID=47885 RepID=UPI00135EB840|nr:hypothetical protein [Pseudomonas oryzihabitans]MXS19266.1 hypothetical protein [Pseudomonas oryzihabitans]